MSQPDPTKPRCDNCPAYDGEEAACHLNPPLQEHCGPSHWCAQHPEIQRQFYEIKTTVATKDGMLAFIEQFAKLVGLPTPAEPRDAPVVNLVPKPAEPSPPAAHVPDLQFCLNGELHTWDDLGPSTSSARTIRCNRCGYTVENYSPLGGRLPDARTVCNKSGHLWTPAGGEIAHCVRCGLDVPYSDPHFRPSSPAQPCPLPSAGGEREHIWYEDGPGSVRCSKCGIQADARGLNAADSAEQQDDHPELPSRPCECGHHLDRVGENLWHCHGCGRLRSDSTTKL
jgi:hypothetical protein